ncbi:MAG TPA: UDP-2,4-diacetamido-2,4,6-trideoxy-beta-L-altropyranose hydrolase [Syntrophales bacterium]|nr:UDP-2,4-diacetamido-2,4,6-trideoxy-beta-L-altropyranose hydrolase [Syntrophales bacterium]
MNSLLIRADATTEMGTGHIMRCLALAQAWQMGGNRAFLLSHCESDALRQRVEATGVGFIPLDNSHPDPADLQTTLTLLRELQAEWLVIDGYHFDPTYQQMVRSAGNRILVIDDNAHLPEYHADILLNQNINAGQLSYVCDTETKLLLGPKYALLRPEFFAWRGQQREIPQAARKVLVTMGGSDPDNSTLKVIQAVQQMDVPGLETRIVVGSANPHLEILNHAVHGSACNFRLLTDVSDMSEQMAWAEVAVSAGGSTCWELAFMGVPTIVLVLAENQRSSAEGLAQAGMAINLGWFDHGSDRQISAALKSLLNDHEQRTQMSTVGQRLIDGNGSRHVLQAMWEQNDVESIDGLNIRLANMLDSVPLYELANDLSTRMNAFNPDTISFDRHVEWLKRKLTSQDTLIWTLEFEGRIVGQIRYDRVDEDVAEIDFAVVPTFRGKGLCAKALSLTCETACAELGVKRLVGITFDSNLPSARSFVKAGFKLVEEGKQLHGHSCSIFERSYKGAA